MYFPTLYLLYNVTRHVVAETSCFYLVTLYLEKRGKQRIFVPEYKWHWWMKTNLNKVFDAFLSSFRLAESPPRDLQVTAYK